ncbi:hypothetical protein C9374_003603 [Naegleria lovaniensis]|uniref:BD-FAE-like domain-containing protein n=1 Tax=Naegleria lovaniensis TaxID=51637 RepID=A0AA88H071_NAELO|nr:uncharacterized protein C9374_003603 [Naegleria lovaniensis]KAG2393839.1 hypothetical protein C9374_003603 [Naegleria lovaniensis]
MYALWVRLKQQVLGLDHDDGETVNIPNDHIEYDEFDDEVDGSSSSSSMMTTSMMDETTFQISEEDLNNLPSSESNGDLEKVNMNGTGNNTTLQGSRKIQWKLCRTTPTALEIYKKKKSEAVAISSNPTSGSSTQSNLSESPKKQCILHKKETTTSMISVTVREGLYEVESCRDVPYFEGSNDPKHKLNIFRSRVKRTGTQENAKLPVLFFCHGGSWRRGDRNHRWFDTYSRLAMRICQDFPCIFVVIGYRLAPAVKAVPDQCEDVLSSFQFCVDNIEKYGGDSSNMVLFGHSAGAHLISLCLLKYGMNLKNLKEPQIKDGTENQRDLLDRQLIEKIKGVICVGAVFDVQYVADRVMNLPRKLIVEPAFGVAENYEECSPIFYVEKERLFFTKHIKDLKSVPSFFISNAENDLTLFSFFSIVDQGEQFAQKMKQVYQDLSPENPLWNSERPPQVKYKRYGGHTNHFTIIGLGASMGNAYEPLVEDIIEFSKQVFRGHKILEQESLKEQQLAEPLTSTSTVVVTQTTEVTEPIVINSEISSTTQETPSQSISEGEFAIEQTQNTFTL